MYYVLQCWGPYDFLALGAALGPWGLGLVDVGLESPALRVIATLALVLASNLPDIDVVLMARSDAAYLLFHRGLTHSFLGLLLLPPLLALALWWGLGKRTRLAWLLALTWLGATLHVLYDLLTHGPVGVKVAGSNRMPSMPYKFSASAKASPSIHGAPSVSNGSRVAFPCGSRN